MFARKLTSELPRRGCEMARCMERLGTPILSKESEENSRGVRKYRKLQSKSELGQS